MSQLLLQLPEEGGQPVARGEVVGPEGGASSLVSYREMQQVYIWHNMEEGKLTVDEIKHLKQWNR